MLGLEPQYLRDDEIDLREAFLVLWRGRWTIVALVIVAALAAGVGGRILITPSYETEATLLIMPPTYQSAINPEPLPLQTYQALALTPSIANEVIDRLQLEDAKGTELAASSVLKAISAEISAPQGTRTDNGQIAGILRIKVTWDDPDKAKDIANVWADVFMDNTSHIRKSESDEIAQVILNQFASTEEALEDAETGLLEFRASGGIPLVSQEVKLLTTQLGKRREYILSMQSELESKRHQLETLSKQVDSLEQAGEWLGLLTHDIQKLKDNGDPMRRRIIEARKQVTNAEAALSDFENQAKISLIEQELWSEQDRLSGYRNTLAALKVQRPQLKAVSSALTAILKNQEDKLVMSRSITTDALWIALSDDQQSLDELTNIRLEDELMNPNYQHVERLLVDTEAELAAIPNKIAAYEKLVQETTDRISELEARLREQKRERQVLEDQLALSLQLYDSMKGQYSALKQQWAQLGSEVAILEGQARLALGELEHHEAAVLAAERRLLELQLDEERFARSIESLSRTYNALAEHAESARLTELQATSDVRFVSPAVAPRSPSSPNHKLNVAIAIVLAGMVGIGVVFIRNVFSTAN